MFLHVIWLAGCFILHIDCFFRNYDVKVLGIEIEDSEYFSQFKIRATRVSRSEIAVNGTADMVKDIPKEALLIWSVFEKTGYNDYNELPLFYRRLPFCDFVVMNSILVDGLQEHSNIPKECPVNKMQFQVNRYIVKEDHLPLIVTGDYWKAIFDLYQGITENAPKLFSISVLLHFDRSNYNKNKKNGTSEI